MDFAFNVYSTFLIVCGLLTLILAGYIFKQGGSTVKWFSVMMFANSIWSIAYGLELASSTIKQIKILINIEYIGIATVPILWFIFCLYFSGKECWYKKPLNFISIVTIPIVTILMVWTNPLHHLHYKSLTISLDGPFPIANIEPGPWYLIFTTYFYVTLACGTFLVIKKFKTIDSIYKKQNYSIVIAALVPWITNMFYLLGIRPFGHIDLTPFAFIIATFLIFIGIYRFKLFDIIPIAREKVLALMQDGFFVLDHQNRIIDYNKSTTQFIDSKINEDLIAKHIEYVLPNQPQLLEHIETHTPGKVELNLTVDGNYFYLEADILFLNENKINNNFTIIKLQDLTTLKKDAITAKEQAKELEKLNQLKDRIFSIIAHDLRGPLVNLSEVLKMISNNQISTEEFKILSPSLSKDIIYTTDLLENILHWSRSQLKGFGIKKEFFNLRSLIINEINYHLPAATLKQIKIIHDVFPGEMVYADILMIQIVMRNIINNAIKFCHPNCEINITAAYQKNHNMLICIQDNGIGIPEDVIDKIFKEENVTTRGTSNEKGTGLGLMVCKDFMERNDGDITVTSTVGVGSKFCITVPTSL
ncbi:MAG: histidine kinase N-terminal 7TM domain-containing protein [Bacteroidota bacterium]|uniref:histidine kinase n=1 Tax=Pedobacter cryotolerans TaxID=2571270 RepID=A0A4U1C196_9SPHI|nr:histidine kinase N-terminal 7TM domain-containing protein [Pedobacter cryotolerans]TKB99399.1 PAS domain-containing sensor histidine kinase [Pedobacter cryotolerans]